MAAIHLRTRSPRPNPLADIEALTLPHWVETASHLYELGFTTSPPPAEPDPDDDDDTMPGEFEKPEEPD